MPMIVRTTPSRIHLNTIKLCGKVRGKNWINLSPDRGQQKRYRLCLQLEAILGSCQSRGGP